MWLCEKVFCVPFTSGHVEQSAQAIALWEALAQSDTLEHLMNKIPVFYISRKEDIAIQDSRFFNVYEYSLEIVFD